LWRVRVLLSSVDIPNFELLSIEPHLKDGGAFAKFRYLDPGGSVDTREVIEEQLREQVYKKGGLPSWAGLERSDIWIVKGRPWREVRLDFYAFHCQVLSYYTGYEPFCFAHRESHI
jgi:hypothetical protein